MVLLALRSLFHLEQTFYVLHIHLELSTQIYLVHHLMYPLIDIMFHSESMTLLHIQHSYQSNH